MRCEKKATLHFAKEVGEEIEYPMEERDQSAPERAAVVFVAERTEVVCFPLRFVRCFRLFLYEISADGFIFRLYDNIARFILKLFEENFDILSLLQSFWYYRE